MLQMRLIRAASYVALVFFSAVLFLACFSPIYPDEIYYRLLNSRLFRDEGRLLMMVPQCLTVAAPWFWLPERLIEWALYGRLTDLLAFRFIGVALFLLWIGVMVGTAKVVMGKGFSFLYSMAGIVSFTSLGTLPLMMVLNRPEQILRIGAATACLLPLIAGRVERPSRRNTLLLGLPLLGAAALMLPQHPKAMLFLPLLSVSLYYICRPSRDWLAFLLLASSLGLLADQSFSVWNARVQCVEALGFVPTVPLSLLRSDPFLFFQTGLKSLYGFAAYLDSASFRSQYQVLWLPSAFHTPAFLLRPLHILVRTIFSLALAYGILALYLRLRRDYALRRLTVETAMPLALSVTIAIVGFFQAHKIFYDSSLILPLILLVDLLLVSEALPWISPPSSASYAAVMLLLSSFASQAYLLSSFHRLIGIRESTIGPSIALSNYDSTRTHMQIDTAALRCGIGKEKELRLAVDDMTYFAFQRTREPTLITYLYWVKVDLPGRLLAFLAGIGSTGIITRCDTLLSDLRPFAVREGDICCLGRAQTDRARRKLPQPFPQR